MLTTMGCWTLRNSNSRSSLRMTRWRKQSIGTSETVLAAEMLLDTWHEEQHFLDCWETNVTFSRLIISDGLSSVPCPCVGRRKLSSTSLCSLLMIARTLCWVSKSITVLCALCCCWLSLLRWWIRVQIVQRWVAQTIQISRYEAAVNTNIRPRPRTRASRGPGRRVIKHDIEQYRHPQSPGCPTIGKCWSRPAQESRDYGNDGKCIDK